MNFQRVRVAILILDKVYFQARDISWDRKRSFCNNKGVI